jgi:hypothetical protein
MELPVGQQDAGCWEWRGLLASESVCSVLEKLSLALVKHRWVNLMKWDTVKSMRRGKASPFSPPEIHAHLGQIRGRDYIERPD